MIDRTTNEHLSELAIDVKKTAHWAGGFGVDSDERDAAIAAADAAILAFFAALNDVTDF